MIVDVPYYEKLMEKFNSEIERDFYKYLKQLSEDKKVVILIIDPNKIGLDDIEYTSRSSSELVEVVVVVKMLNTF